MKNLILFDDHRRNHLLPLTYTRPAAALRVGILTIQEKWEKYTGLDASHSTEDYLAEKYTRLIHQDFIDLNINGRLLPAAEILEQIMALAPGEGLRTELDIIAYHGNDKSKIDFTDYTGPLSFIERPHDIFTKNEDELQKDFDLITDGRESAPLNDTNTLIAVENIFAEAGAKVSCAILNASSGPIYIGKDAEIMEGVVVRGGLAMCNNSVLKLGAKIYGATTLGPYCKVGGEVNNSVLTGYSSKAHDGFLGNSVLGEWCNLGADSNNSNLKNNYAEVKLWNYEAGRFSPTGLQFCGLIMGDHSKCGINTMFNTGTLVGVSANVYGGGFPRNFIPSFSWGGASGFTTYKFSKVKEVATKVMARRKKEFDEVEEKILQNVFEQSSKYRKWES
jgi:UDP-N-acetylglucosamine diphosphorylase/glucosamine-1-phosphate N-acetyltransferase